MNSYAFFADLILIVHASFIAFVVFGQLLVVVGYYADWRWVRNFWFRAVHLAAIFYVVAESWLSIICPLTEWEQALRRKAGQNFYSGGFIANWLHKIIFFDLSDWVFTAIYSVFGLIVAASFYLCPPHWPWRNKKSRRK